MMPGPRPAAPSAAAGKHRGMSDDLAPAPRPVADVPPPPLADGEAVAKAGLGPPRARAPLAPAPAVPVPALAAGGPALCAALLEAVGSEAALDRLRSGGDRAAPAAGTAADARRRGPGRAAGAAGTGAIAGARDPAAAAAAVAALRGTLWRALARELHDLDGAATA